MRSTKKNSPVLIILLLVLFSSCGYHFTGGGDFPGGVTSVFVKLFENRTSETGLENFITNDLIYEVTRMKMVSLVSENKADAILSGIVTSMSVNTIAYQGTQSSLERRVVITVDMNLKDRDGRDLWSRKGITEYEEYDVSDKYTTETNRREAIKTLSKRLSEKIYSSITDSF